MDDVGIRNNHDLGVADGASCFKMLGHIRPSQGVVEIQSNHEFLRNRPQEIESNFYFTFRIRLHCSLSADALAFKFRHQGLKTLNIINNQYNIINE